MFMVLTSRLRVMAWVHCGPQNGTLFIIARTLCTVDQFSQYLAHIYYRKFGTRKYIVSPADKVMAIINRGNFYSPQWTNDFAAAAAFCPKSTRHVSSQLYCKRGNCQLVGNKSL